MWPMLIPIMSAAASAAGPLLNRILGRDPTDKAMENLDQIQGRLSPFFTPYINAGQNALGQLPGIYGNLLNNPTDIMNKIGSTYQESPGYQWQLKQGLNAANNAAASGGMLGSPQHQQIANEVANGLANQDYYNYLQHGLGLYGQGLSGLQGLSSMGLQAGSEYGSDLADVLGARANYAYQGQAAQNQAQGADIGNALSSALSIMQMFGSK